VTVTSRWEIYLTDFGPRRGHAPALEHPALILSSDLINRQGITVTVAPFHGKLRRLYPAEVIIQPEGTGLDTASILQVQMIHTVDQGKLRSYIGEIRDPIDRRAIEAAVSLALGDEQ